METKCKHAPLKATSAAMSIERKSLMHLKMERWQSG